MPPNTPRHNDLRTFHRHSKLETHGIAVVGCILALTPAILIGGLSRFTPSGYRGSSAESFHQPNRPVSCPANKRSFRLLGESFFHEFRPSTYGLRGRTVSCRLRQRFQHQRHGDASSERGRGV